MTMVSFYFNLFKKNRDRAYIFSKKQGATYLPAGNHITVYDYGLYIA
jgi:hypothetical protein